MPGKFEQKKQQPPKRPKKKFKWKKYRGLLLYILVPLLCGCIFGAWMMSNLPGFDHIGDRLSQPEKEPARQEEIVETQNPPTETQPEETEPVTKVATATIGATGDILLHDLVIKSGYDEKTETYNFDNIFTWFSKYVSEVDYAAANLEVTLCGENNGYRYSGYPSFNSPDEIVDAAKTAGFDLLLTANNHTYDTGYDGFKRTQEVIDARELDHIGTRLHKDGKNYIVREINGIKVGMTCYTYLSGYTNARNYMLNGIALNSDATARLNGFHYKDLENFYTKLAGELQQMAADGAEATVVFIHWGTEYKLAPNESQKKIAQRLCDMGVDVIVGNHPHVAQPVELLTSSTSDTSKTLCIYSTGNSVSNIYKSDSFPVHTEDGMLFTFTFAKYSDGTVLVESTDVLPTWVHRYDENGIRKFRIMTMKTGADWKTDMDLTDELMTKCQQSYDRTMEIVGAGLKTANEWFAAHQEEIEAKLGVK
jgi:poly-gamma-glutamate synthesis protein (capsule biosynthesis protein)